MAYSHPVRTDTAFHVPLIGGLFNNKEVGILMVHNISDLVATGHDGKPAGWGLPGGGVSLERDDNPTEAVRNELLAETGLIVQNPVKVMEIGRIILESGRNRMTGQRKLLRQIDYEIGQTPPYTFDYSRGGRVIDSHIHAFIGHVNFKDSALERLMRDKPRSFRRSTYCGLRMPSFIVRLDETKFTASEISELNIQERDEIDAIGIFPLSYLARLLSIYDSKRTPREKRVFYKGHLKWATNSISEYENRRRIEVAQAKLWADAIAEAEKD
jgi:8-oxo-dGTP pyrophosphatase MutT (NUDIX family)